MEYDYVPVLPDTREWIFDHISKEPATSVPEQKTNPIFPFEVLTQE